MITIELPGCLVLQVKVTEYPLIGSYVPLTTAETL